MKEAGLNSLDLTGRDLDGILITHEHSDHIKGLGVLARKYGTPIYDQSDRAGRASPWKRYVLSFDHGWKAMERKPWRD